MESLALGATGTPSTASTMSPANLVARGAGRSRKGESCQPEGTRRMRGNTQSRGKLPRTDFNFFEAPNRKILEDAPDAQPAAMPSEHSMVQRGIQILARDRQPHLRASQRMRGLPLLRPCRRRRPGIGHYLLPRSPAPAVTGSCMRRLCRLSNSACRYFLPCKQTQSAGLPSRPISQPVLR